MGTERFGANVLSFIGNIVLSYYVAPSEFGIVASLGIIVNLIFVLIDCGLSDGIVRYEKATNKDFNTLFWFNAFAGCVLCLIFNIIAPFVSEYLKIPETENVIRVFGLSAIFSALAISQTTRIRYNLSFRTMSLINLGAVVSMLVISISLAILGAGYWAVAMLTLGYSFFVLLYLILFTKWHLRFEFSMATFKDLWGFGVNLLFSIICTQVAQNIYTFILGKVSATQSGLFGQAQKLEQAPMKTLESTITYTSYVTIAKYSDYGRKRELMKVYRAIVLILASFSGLAFALSDPLIGCIFPEKWHPVVPYFKLLILLGFVQAMSRFLINIYKLYNRTDLLRNLVLVENLLIISNAVVLFTLKYDMFTIIYGALSITIFMNLVMLYVGSRLSGIKYGSFLIVYLKKIIAIFIAVCFVLAVNSMFDSQFVQVAMGFIVFCVIMVIYLRLFDKEHWNYIHSLVRRRNSK